MRYFNRTNRLANILLALSVVCFIAMWIVIIKEQVIDQVLQYSNGNVVRGAIFFIFFLTATIFFLIIGVTLKCIVKDAKEEFDIINNKIRETERK